MRVFDLHQPPANVLAFLSDRHFASLTTVRPGGGLHAAVVGFVYDPVVADAHLILRGSGVKLANLRSGGGSSEAVLCQVVNGQWVSLEGTLTIDATDEARIAAVEKYRSRYGEGVVDDPARIAGVMAVTRMYGFVLPLQNGVGD